MPSGKLVEGLEGVPFGDGQLPHAICDYLDEVKSPKTKKGTLGDVSMGGIFAKEIEKVPH